MATFLILRSTFDLWQVFGILVVAVFIFIAFLRPRNDNPPLPPGPRGLPLVGNLVTFLQAGRLPWLHYTKLSQQYGPSK